MALHILKLKPSVLKLSNRRFIAIL